MQIRISDDCRPHLYATKAMKDDTTEMLGTEKCPSAEENHVLFVYCSCN